MRISITSVVLSAIVAMSVLALPTFASAAPQLKNTKGNALLANSPLRMSSAGFRTQMGLISISCASNIIDGTLTSNSGGFEEQLTSASFIGSGPSGACATNQFSLEVAFSFNGPWCLRSTVVGLATVDGCGSSTAGLHTDIYHGGAKVETCDYALKSATFSYQEKVTPLLFTVQSFELERIAKSGSLGVCTSLLQGEGSFTVTSTGNNVQVVN